MMPGKIFLMIGSYLDEKLPAIVFANKTCFKGHIKAMLEDYVQRRNFVQLCLQDGGLRQQEDVDELKMMEKIYDGIVENIGEFAKIVNWSAIDF